MDSNDSVTWVEVIDQYEEDAEEFTKKLVGTKKMN